MKQQFELRRQSDGLVYHFAQDGIGVFRRSDRPDLTIQWDPKFGWAAFDPASGELAGLAWGVSPNEQGSGPPAGTWVSYKEGRSYVYDLVYADKPNAPRPARRASRCDWAALT